MFVYPAKIDLNYQTCNMYVSKNQLVNNDFTIYHAIFFQYTYNTLANRRFNQRPF